MAIDHGAESSERQYTCPAMPSVPNTSVSTSAVPTRATSGIPALPTRQDDQTNLKDPRRITSRVTRDIVPYRIALAYRRGGSRSGTSLRREESCDRQQERR